MDPIFEAYMKKKVDTTYCVVIHDKVHVQHVVMYKDKPDIHNIRQVLDELETDEDFKDNFTAPLNELNLDLMTFGEAMRCMPEDWQATLTDLKEKL